MTITRAQIPSQIDPFDNGGDVTFTDNNARELSKLIKMSNGGSPSEEELKRQQQIKDLGGDYNINLDKYKSRLDEFLPEPRRMNIYDIASQLGASLLSTPNTGGASAFTGLGIGFSKLNDKMENEFLNQQKQKLQIGMQASQMAMESEREAEQFLNQQELLSIKEANSLKPHLYIEGPANPDTNELLGRDTKVGTPDFTQKRDNQNNSPTIDFLISQGWRIVDDPETIINNNLNQETDESKEGAKRISAFQAKLMTETAAASNVRTQVQQARKNAMDLTENGKYTDRYGAVPSLTNPIRNYLSGLGFTNINLDRLASEDVGNQLGTNFAMATVALTKGAISNKEMDMFLRAAPTMARTYGGYMKMLEYMDRIADRTESFATEYITEKRRLRAEKNPDGSKKYTGADFYDAVDLYGAEWHRNNPLFIDEAETRQIIADADNKSYSKALSIYENYNQSADSGDVDVNAINAEIQNLKNLLDKNEISLDDYNVAIRKANRAKSQILSGEF